MKARLAAAATLAMLTALVLTATASASEPLEDGEYTIALPDGDIVFTIAEDGEMLTVESLPEGYAVSEDDSSDADSTEIVGNGVIVEIETGDDGKIEIEGVSFGADTVVSALLPGVTEPITITATGDDIDVSAPASFEVIDVDTDGDEVEVTITDGDRTFEIEVDLEDGSVEIKRQDDDSSDVDDDSSDDDESSVDSVDDTTVPTVAGTDDDDSSDEDDDSSDDDESSVDSVDDTTVPTVAGTDDDDSSDEVEDSSDDDSSDDDSSD